jgi:PadR family transcriptional regulator PadR
MNRSGTSRSHHSRRLRCVYGCLRTAATLSSVRAMRTTESLVRVAVALLDDPHGDHYGYPLGKRSGVRSGVLYPILARMLDEEWLTDSWEDESVAHAEGRPSRRIYHLTERGRRELGAIESAAREDARFKSMLPVRFS